MVEPVSRGDKFPIPFKVNGDLTGKITTVTALKLGAAVGVTIPYAVTNAASGEGNLTDTSSLGVGSYRLELEALGPGDERVTYRMKDPLRVVQDYTSPDTGPEVPDPDTILDGGAP